MRNVLVLGAGQSATYLIRRLLGRARRRHSETVSDARAAGWRREPKARPVLGALIWVLLAPWVILTGCVSVLMALVTLPALVWKVGRGERGGGSR